MSNHTVKSPFIKVLEREYAEELKYKEAFNNRPDLINNLVTVAECKRARMQAKFEEELERPLEPQVEKIKRPSKIL